MKMNSQPRVIRASFGRRAIAVSLSVGVAAAMLPTIAFAQTATPGATPVSTPISTPTATPTDSTSSTQAGGGSIGSLLTTPRAAIPLPNPNIAYNAAYPNQRGFIRSEPFFVYPFVALGFGHNDNLTGVKDNRISSSLLTVTPRISADLKYGASTHSLVYQGNYGRYSGSSADNFTEHEIIGRTANQFDARNDLTASAYYLNKQDARGLLTRPFSDVPDKWSAFGANGTYGYGARSAQGRLEFDLGFTDKTYDNNRAVTQGFDVSTLNLAGRFLYRIAPRTRLLTELRYTSYDYKTSNIDSDEVRMLVGATWDLAATTSGTVKIGQVRKNFKNSALADFSGVNLEAAARWTPRTYSIVEAVLTRQPNDSTGAGFFTVDTAMGVSWTHRWASFVTTRALASYLNSDFEGIARTDKLTTLTMGGYFDIRTWLRLGAEYTFQQRASSVSAIEFNRNVIMFTVGGTL